MDIEKLVDNQREYFFTGATRSYKFRKESLRKLKDGVTDNEDKINEVLKLDLNKHPTESYMTETGIVLDEISYHLKHLKKWMKDKKVKTPLSQFPGKGFVSPEPYGVALIVAPWNYPINLCLDPLIGAISAGNCAVLKPSIYAKNTSHFVNDLIKSIYEPEYITVVEGGRSENQTLFKQKFDYIFFTGSPTVGRVVMEAASKNLTPITLELGGKSPVIVDKTANLKLASKKIAFGKVLNAGQICIDPDYLLIEESVKDEFIKYYKEALGSFFPNNDYSEMPVIINEKHYNRLLGLMEGEDIILGGETDPARRFIEPTLLDNITPESKIMQEEIFGPILPIMTFKDIDSCINLIRSRDKPLALYLFSKDKKTHKRVLNSCSFGGGAINDVIVHIATTQMGFGGVGASGMGSYHGKKSFDTFTHYRNILKDSGRFDIPIRYHPYSEMKDKVLRFFLK